MAEALKIGNDWQVKGGLDSGDTYIKKVLMMSMADTE